jgi:hypothetical protein
MRSRSLLALPLLAVAGMASADPFDCGHTAQRRVASPVAGVTRVVIVARAGSLRVRGESGAAEISAKGTACASDRDDLDRIQLRSERQGSDLKIEAVIPEASSSFFFGFGHQAKLDLEVSLPKGMAVSVTDGSGSARISDVGPLTVTDGSGQLEIRGVNGNARVKDGSGSIDLSDVTGDVEIVDGSGSMDVRDVGGSVVVTDGSGSIEVSDIRGGFHVRDDGSGGIDYERVSGEVRVPRDRRHRD